MPSQPQLTNESSIEDDIHLRDYWRVLVKRRRLIVSVVGSILCMTTVILLLLPNIYKSTGVLIPLGKSATGLEAAFGQLKGLLPASLGGGRTEDPSVRLLAVLQSRTLAEDVINHLDLMPILFADDWDPRAQQWQTHDPPTMQKTVEALGKMVASALDEQKGILTITAEHADPVLAAAIANQYVEALQRALNDNSFSLAKKNRMFIASQLQKTQQDLTTAEEALRQFEQTYGIVALDAQTQAAVSTLAQLEGQIMAKEVQRGVLQRSLTGSSREVYLVEEELKELRAQLARLQYSTPELTSVAQKREQNSQTWIALDQAPEMKLQYVRLQRDALIQNQLFMLLFQQLEQAKIEEVRDETAFQVLDRAIPPEKKAKPKRLLMLILALVMSTFFGVFVALFLNAVDTTIQSGDQVEQRLRMPILAILPPLAPRQHRRSRQVPPPEADLAFHATEGAPLVEALRYLRTRIQHLNGERGPQIVLLTSAESEENVTKLSLNLARVAAQLGDRTLLVDANVHQPTLHHFVHGTAAPGLAELLTNVSVPVQTTPCDNLHFIPAGTMSPTTLAAFESPACDALLARWKEAYDLILCVAPAVLSCSDTVVLSSKVEATCLVLTCGVSRIETISEARSALETVKANVIGAVLMDFNA